MFRFLCVVFFSCFVNNVLFRVNRNEYSLNCYSKECTPNRDKEITAQSKSIFMTAMNFALFLKQYFSGSVRSNNCDLNVNLMREYIYG